jgi:hypothetical protein
MDGGQVDPGSGRNVAQRNRLVALFAKQPLGRIEDFDARITHSTDLIIRLNEAFVKGKTAAALHGLVRISMAGSSLAIRS